MLFYGYVFFFSHAKCCFNNAWSLKYSGIEQCAYHTVFKMRIKDANVALGLGRKTIGTGVPGTAGIIHAFDLFLKLFDEAQAHER